MDPIHREGLSREGRSRTYCEAWDRIATAPTRTDPKYHRTKAEREALWSGYRTTNVCLTESIWTPRSPHQKMLTPKNQLADRLTKGSFTRDEWDHLLRLLNIMNFSMFSCSHFLSNRKQRFTSNRAQESTSKEGSAVAEPIPMNLVSRNLPSAKKNLPQDSSDSNRRVRNWIRVVFHSATGN